MQRATLWTDILSRTRSFLTEYYLLPPAFAHLRLQEDRVFIERDSRVLSNALSSSTKRLQEESLICLSDYRRDHRLRVLVLFLRVLDPT